MNKIDLAKTTKRTKKRVGRGYGSGKGGHTSGRGQKGQKARNSVPSYFGGSAQGSSFIKRLPLLRGKGKLKSFSRKPATVNVKYLNLLPKDTVVTSAILIKKGIIDSSCAGHEVKILGDGNLQVALSVDLPCTKGARVKIEKAGGKVIFGPKKKDNKTR